MNRPSLILWGALAALISGCANDEGETIDPNKIDGGQDAHIVKDGGGDPAMPPNGAEACPQGACNYQTNEGCSGATPSCTPQINGMGDPVGVCTAAGTGKSGTECTVATDCAAGYVCAEKECHKLCCGGDWTGCPSASEHCIVELKVQPTGGEPVDTQAMLCYEVDTCDALKPDSCTRPGTTCQIVDPTGASACFPEGTAAAGESCATARCKGGTLCAIQGDEKVCRQLCAAVEGGDAPYCPDKYACVHYNDKHPANVGECVPLG